MAKKNFCIGIGMGIILGSVAAMLMRPKRSHCMTTAIGRTLKTLGEVADSISEVMGW